MGSLALYQRNKNKGSPQEVQISECFPIYRKYSYTVAIGLTILTFVFHNNNKKGIGKATYSNIIHFYNILEVIKKLCYNID